MCYNFGKRIHIKVEKKGRTARQETEFVLIVKNSIVNKRNRILESGSIKHSVNVVSLLEDPEEHVNECVTANGGSLSITERGRVIIVDAVMENMVKVRRECKGRPPVSDENSLWTVEVPPTIAMYYTRRGFLRGRPTWMVLSNVTKTDSWFAGTSNFSASTMASHLLPL